MSVSRETAPKAPRRKVWRKRLSRVSMAALAVGLVAAIVVGMMPKPVPVAMEPTTRGDLTITVDEDGRTRVKDRYIVSAPLAGNLARIELRPGDRVDEDAVLGRLLPLPSPLLDPQSQAQTRARLAAAQAAHRQAAAVESAARAAFEFAQKEIETERRLAPRGTIPMQRLEQAELELRTRKEDLASASFGSRVARHEVEVAKAALGRLASNGTAQGDGEALDQILLRAPVEGVVLQVFSESEGVVQAGTPLIEIGDPRALEIVIDVLTTDAVRIQPDQNARIVRWGGDMALDARVRRIEPRAFTRLSSLGVEEQRVNVVLDLTTPQDQWASLGDGFRVEADIVVWQTQDALRVPTSAVFRHDGQWNVFVYEAGHARLRTIELGERNGFTAQVLDGLTEGDIVILHPGERVKDGIAVEAQ